MRHLIFFQFFFFFPLLSGCTPNSAETSEPPLRPLLYTEAALGIDPTIETYRAWQDGSDPVAYPSEHQTMAAETFETLDVAQQQTPEALMMTVFLALMNQNHEMLETCLFTPEQLASSAHMGQEAARRVAASIQEDSFDTMALFDQGAPSQARVGGLSSILEAGQIVVGRGRRLNGSVIERNEEPAMYWGSEISFGLIEGNISFELRFPKLLLGPEGRWFLGSAPVADANFRAYRETGMDLKPELMTVEHASFPLSVGSFWEFRTRLPSIMEGEYGANTEGYRDEVVSVDVYNGYRVARIQRSFRQPDVSPESYAYLITPTQVYDCSRQCRRRSANLSWILAYCQRRTPLFVFPLQAGNAWGSGGQREGQTTYHVQLDTVHIGSPAGNFLNTFEIVRSTARGRESTFFQRGIGVVMKRTQSSNETNIIELTSYRILP